MGGGNVFNSLGLILIFDSLAIRTFELWGTKVGLNCGAERRLLGFRLANIAIFQSLGKDNTLREKSKRVRGLAVGQFLDSRQLVQNRRMSRKGI